MNQISQEDMQLIVNIIVAVTIVAMIVSIIRPYIRMMRARRLWAGKGALL